MLSPNEISEHSFSKKISGYNVNEVEEYIAYLLEKYTEVYNQLTDISAKLDTATAALSEYETAKQTAQSIISAADKKANEIISEAQQKAESVSRSVSESCDILIEDYRQKVVVQTEVLCELTEQCRDFKNKLLHGYRAQMDYLNGMDFGPAAQKSDEELINEVLTLAKEHIKQKKAQKPDTPPEANESDFAPVTMSEERSFTDEN